MPIDYKIERRRWEEIGDLIGEIIALEFDNQVLQYYNTDCEAVDIYRDRIVPINHTELSVLNISYSSSEYSNKHQGSKSGEHTFWIDIYCQSASEDDVRADFLANKKLQRLMGIIDDILENPIYKTLGQAPPILSGTMVENTEVVNATKETQDALASVFGRVTFKVRANEENGLLAGNQLLTHLTQIKLGITDKGFRYEYGPVDSEPALDERFVYIVNQYGNVIELLPGGTRYTVTELEEILDDIDDNESTITENLPE